MSDELIKIIHSDVQEIKKTVVEIRADISEIKTEQAVMKLDVKHHVHRSDLLEDLVAHLDESRIQPIEKELAEIKGARKSASWIIGTIITLAATIAAFLLLKH